MVLVYAVNPWTRVVGSWAIKHAVSRARNAVKWRKYATDYIKGLLKGSVLAGSAAAMAGYSTRHFMRGGRRRRETNNAFRPQPQKKRKRDPNPGVEDKGSYTQFDNLGWKVAGKYLSLNTRLAKVLRSSVWVQKDRWQSLAAPNASQQSMTLDYSLVQSAETNQATLPLYMWDLTALQSTGWPANQFPIICQRLYRNNAGSGYDYFFSPIRQFSNDGTTQICSWNPEMTITNPDKAYIPKRFVRDVSMKFLMMGATTKPSRVTIEIWQFLEDGLVPPMRTYTDVTGLAGETYIDGLPGNASADERARYNTFWLQQTDQLHSNPLMTRGTGSDMVKGHKVLYSKTFEFQPIDSGEADTRGHQLQWSLKYGINKLCTYTKSLYTAQTNLNFENEDTYDATSAPNEIRPVCAQKGRVYLVVKGKVFDEGNAVGSCPSVDVVIRRKTEMVSTILSA